MNMSFLTAFVIVVFMLCVTFLILARMVTKTTIVGKMVVDQDPDTGKLICRLELDVDPHEILDLKNISFKVVKMEAPAD